MPRKHPNGNVFQRIQTFQYWPLKTPSARALANSGFIYLGQSDFVKCPVCKIVIGNWKTSDNPWLRHCRNSRSCQFIVDFELRELSIFKDVSRRLQNGLIKSFIHLSRFQHVRSFSSFYDKLYNILNSPICQICFNHNIEILFEPCYHLITCKKCSRKVSLCPICRQPICKKQRIYIG